jgi:hypothetical protein
MVINNTTLKKEEKTMWEDAAIISAYTRAQAIEDGVLVDMNQGEFGEVAREAGFQFPIAMTATAYGQYVDLTPAAVMAGNDRAGRWWDILWMLKHGIQSCRGNSSELLFNLHCVVDRIRPTPIALKSVCGPGDNGEPVITIMLPEED